MVQWPYSGIQFTTRVPSFFQISNYLDMKIDFATRDSPIINQVIICPKMTVHAALNVPSRFQISHLSVLVQVLILIYHVILHIICHYIKQNKFNHKIHTPIHICFRTIHALLSIFFRKPFTLSYGYNYIT